MTSKASSAGSTDFVPTFTGLDYVRFFASGGLCATATHGAMVPLDVLKTRIQLESKGSPLNSMGSMAKHVIKTEGPAGLMTGFGATSVGYLVQGGAKFAGFEFFKAKFAKAAGSQAEAQKYRTAIYIGGAASAELVATTLLTPLEAARIRAVSERNYAKNFIGALGRMASEGGIGALYAGYIPILFKQIPFTIAQFVTNENMHELVKNTPSLHNFSQSGKVGEVAIDLGCGLTSGVAAAVVSHPADTLLSKINKGGGGSGSAMSKLAVSAKEVGFAGMWAGLGTRIVMTALLISSQFGLYGQFKKAFGAQEGVSIAKVETEKRS
ncbi:unnamed protein product [Sympodiomycopsis kandeliae]